MLRGGRRARASTSGSSTPQLSIDPTGLSLPILMEELFWGCAGIGLSIVMPALALAAIRQAATDEQLVRWAPQCFGTPGRHQARRAGGDRAERRQRRPLDPDPRAPGRRRLGDRRPQGVHRQRRDRRRPRRRGHRRPRRRSPRPGRVHRPQGHPRACTMLRKLDKLGCRASHTGEIVLEDCRVPGEHLLGGDERLAGADRQRARGRAGPPQPVAPAKKAARPRPCSGAARPPSERSSAPGRWSPRRRSGSLARRSSSRATTPSRARRSGSRSSRTRASPSRSPTSPPTSTPPGC